jgi:erythromycin esterase-like protein
MVSITQLGRIARPIMGEAELGELLDLVGDARIVVLGASTYGTHEHYDLQASLARKLLADRGFNAVVIESDWSDALLVDRYVRHRADGIAGAFEQFPAWVWRNEDMTTFVDWIRYQNTYRRSEDRIGFYALDVYSLLASIRATRSHGDADDDLVAELVDMQWRRAARSGRAPSGVAWFRAMQDAHLVGHAERYYRTMLRGGDIAWNLRSRHMADTLDMLALHTGDKLVVWAHDAHAGDARAIDTDRWSLGQLLRERHPGEVALIGFTTFSGTVRFAPEWGAQDRVEPLPPAGEWEQLFHESGVPRFMVTSSSLRRSVSDRIQRSRRVIDVIERSEPYYDARLADQYDVIVHVDVTRAVEPREPMSAKVRTV